MTQLDLLKDNERKVFNHYLLPSICSTLVTAIYLLADTLIIGNGIGPRGISSLNIILPLFSLYMGVGLLFGIGGGVMISTEDGLGNSDKSNKYLITSLLSVLSVAILLTILLTSNLKNIAYFLGANESSIELVMEYGKYITICTPIFILTNFFGPIIRNRKEPKLCMKAVIIGSVLNILLDYIFVYPLNMGMKGAAIATVLGSLITLSILLTHFLNAKNRVHLSVRSTSLTMLKKILACGFSSFLMEIASGFIIFIFNIQILKYIGDDGVVVFGVISNCILVGTAIFNGIAQATQPILAINFGAKESERISNILRLAKKTTILAGVALFIVSFIFTRQVIALFMKADNSIYELGIPAIRTYLSAFCLMSVNILYCTYFQSVGKETLSVGISIIRGFAFNLILLFTLPYIFGGRGIWAAVPLTELLTFTLINFYTYFKKDVVH